MTSLIEKWLTSVKDSTAKTYKFHFRHFLEYFGITAEEILQEAKTDRIETKTKLNLWYKHLRDQKKSHNTAALSEKAVKSFLRFFEIKQFKTQSRKRPRKYRRKVLRKEHIKKLVEASQYLRGKALIIMSFQTGMAISDLLSLNYGNVKDVIENEITFPEYLKDVRIIRYIREKEETEGIAIIGKDSIDYFRQYITWRKEQGNNLTDDTPLFVGVRDFESNKRLTERSAQAMMRKTIVKAGLATYEELKKYGKINPYSFHAIRKAFSSIAELHEMPPSQIEMSQGHSVNYNFAYKEFTEREMIENFKKVEPYLSISYDEKLEEQDERIKEQEDKIRDLEANIQDLEQQLYERVQQFLPPRGMDMEKEIKALKEAYLKLQSSLKGQSKNTE